MKKLFLYIAIAIVIVACGVSIYYVVRNDENIYSTIDVKEILYLNVGEEVDIPVVHEKPNANTTIDVASNSEIININTESWKLSAKEPGMAMLTITPSNENFQAYEISVFIGNGSNDFPYFIRNEQDLLNIGNDWSLGDSYQLVKDINITSAFMPIGNKTSSQFLGSFNGDGFKIIGLVIDSSVADSSLPAGLFSEIGESGKVENLIIENAKVSVNSRFAGIIAGKNYGLIGKCQILNSSIINSIPEKHLENGADSYTGVICGLNESKNSYARVSLCTVKADVSADFIAGGAVGFNKAGVITNNDIRISTANIIPTSINEDKYLFGGIAGRVTNSTSEIKTSCIINNLAVIENINANLERVGGVFGITSTTDLDSKGFYSMLLYNSGKAIKPVCINANDFEISNKELNARNYSVSISKAEINKQNTYKIKGSNWDTKTIWSIIENQSASINYLNEALDYQELPVLGKVFEISSNAELKEAIEYMSVYPTARVSYIIKGKSTQTEQTDENGEPVLDEEGMPVVTVNEKTYTFKVKESFSPIGSRETPFQGIIAAEHDAKIVIEGLGVSGEYAGLFAYLGQNAKISNIVIKDASVSGTVIGGVAGFNNGGTIDNCIVEGSKLTSTKYAGAIVGYNGGTITNCQTSYNEILVNEENQKNIYLAGIAGKSKGQISNCVAKGLSVEVSIETEENTVCLGGIAGFIQDCSIDNSRVYELSVDTHKYLGRTYAGGISGYILDGKVSSCGVTDSMQVKLNTENSSSIAGGIAGFMSSEGKVSKCSVGSIILISHSSAGLVSFNLGEISQSYSGTNALMEGKYVAGMVCNHYGNISDSYTISKLSGSKIEAGMATFLWKGSKIEHSYTYCSFSGNTSGYAETSSNYKARADLFGTIENSIIVGNNIQDLAKPGITDWYETYIISQDGLAKVKVQVIYFVIKGTYNYISEEALLGQDLYKTFNDLEFNKNIWSYDETTMGSSPILTEACDLKDSAFNVIVKTENTESENLEVA